MAVSLPLDFVPKALAQFDALYEQGLMFYEKPEVETVECTGGFKIHFIHTPILHKKPILARLAPARLGPGGPFVHPDPRFVVTDAGPAHLLEMTMHAVYRPHFVLHTRAWRPQTEDLDAQDWEAALGVMGAWERGLDALGEVDGGGGEATKGGTKEEAENKTRDGAAPQRELLVLYNQGYDAGASQGHKHLQLFPLPAQLSSPSTAAADTENPLRLPVVHFRAPLPPAASNADVLHTYQGLLARARAFQAAHAQGEGEGEGVVKGDLNVLMTRRWVMVVPRRMGGREGVGANGLGMLGVVWVADAVERGKWDEFGMEAHLRDMGYGLPV